MQAHSSEASYVWVLLDNEAEQVSVFHESSFSGIMRCLLSSAHFNARAKILAALESMKRALWFGLSPDIWVAE